MGRTMHSCRAQRQVVARDQATLYRAWARSIICRTSVAGLIGLVYGICTGVILAAYHEFGSASLLKPTRFVAADPEPTRLLPQEGLLDDDDAAHPSARPQALVTALADAVPLTSAAGSAPLTPPDAEIRPAVAGWAAAEPVSEVAASAASRPPRSAQLSSSRTRPVLSPCSRNGRWRPRRRWHPKSTPRFCRTLRPPSLRCLERPSRCRPGRSSSRSTCSPR
jgi:hypothetical protein